MPFQIKPPPELENFKDKSATKTAIKAAKAWLESLSTGRYPYYNCFACFSKKGEVKKESGDCHYGAPNLVRSTEGPSLLATCSGPRTKSSMEVFKPFLNWFLNDSPFSFLILNRDDPDFCLDHGFLLSIDAPRQYVHGACIITRHFREIPEKVFEKFNELTELQGIDPLIAYSVCFNSTYSSRSPNKSLRDLFRDHTSHRLGRMFWINDFVNVVNGNPCKSIRISYKQDPSIKGCSVLWRASARNTPRQIRDDRVLQSLLQGKKGVEKYTPPNPFSNKPIDSYYCEKQGFITIEKAFTVLVPYLQKEVEKALQKDDD